MKSPQNPTKARRPYDAPMLTREQHLKSQTAFAGYDGRSGSTDDNEGGDDAHYPGRD